MSIPSLKYIMCPEDALSVLEYLIPEGSMCLEGCIQTCGCQSLRSQVARLQAGHQSASGISDSGRSCLLQAQPFSRLPPSQLHDYLVWGAQERMGMSLPTAPLYDIQIKRIHADKR